MNTTRGSQVKPVQPLMHDWVFLNNQLLRKNEAVISAVSGGALYGKGVFTTVAVFDGLPFLFDKHWNRLKQNASVLEMPFGPLRKEDLFSNILELIDRNEFQRGKCRISLFDETVPGIWGGDFAVEPAVMIQTGETISESNLLSLNVSPVPVVSTSVLNNIKSCNYLERLMAFEAARKSGFDEAVRINERGEIVSACMSNIFWSKDEKIYTPAVETGCLKGTTRTFVMDQREVFTSSAGIESLRTADHVFLTSAGIGAVSVGQIVFGTETVSYKTISDGFFDENGLEKLRIDVT